MAEAHAPYRVFISYSHDDRVIAEIVEEHLREIGVTPMWDPLVLPGASFSDELRDMISFAHVFLPILTPGSDGRPWVHQEIGYAMALGTPVLPLSFGALPPGMADRLQALTISEEPVARCQTAVSTAVAGSGAAPALALPDDQRETLKDALQAKLTMAEIQDAVALYQGTQTALPVLCAPEPEDRTLMLIEHLVAIFRHNKSAEQRQGARCATQEGGVARGVRIRHEAPFGTLSLPNAPASDKIWRCRDGLSRRSSDWLRARFRRERVWTEKHVHEGGCDLILHPEARHGSAPVTAKDADQRQGTLKAEAFKCSERTRLKVLIEFVVHMRQFVAKNPELGKDFCRIIVSDKIYPGNTLIAGDWFVAETVTPSEGRGFQHTIITRHAPTVSERAKQFDADFQALLEKQKLIKPGASRKQALKDLRKRLAGLGPAPCEAHGFCPLEELERLTKETALLQS